MKYCLGYNRLRLVEAAFVSPPGSLEVGVRIGETGVATVGVCVVGVEVFSRGVSLASHGLCPCGHL